MDKSRVVEGIIETTLIPGKLEEFITQMTPILTSDVSSIYGDDKLTGLLKDVINEKDAASKLAKAKVLRDAVKVSSVLYSEENSSFSEVNGECPKGEGLPNQVNKDDSVSVAGTPVKTSDKDISGLLNQLTASTEKLTTVISKLAPTNAPAPTHFAAGPGVKVEAGPTVSSCPASVPADSNHVTVFAEDIREGDIYNGRKVVAITEEKSPVEDTTLYSFELDDRSIIKANAGTPVTFSSIDDIVASAANKETNMELTFSQNLAKTDFEKGIRTYSENFSNIMDYHDMDQNFDAEEYVAAFSQLENQEESDPLYQLNQKIDQLSAQIGAQFSENDENQEEEVEYSEEAAALAAIFSEMSDVVFDEETGAVFGKYNGNTYVFSDKDEMVYLLNDEQQLVPSISYSELLSGEEEEENQDED